MTSRPGSQDGLEAAALVAAGAGLASATAEQATPGQGGTMRFVISNLVLATWLLLTAFALPHSAFTQATTWVAAVLVGGAALVAPGRPPARYAISVLALALAGIALLAPGISAAAALNNALVAAVLFALSLVNPEPKPVLAPAGGAETGGG